MQQSRYLLKVPTIIFANDGRDNIIKELSSAYINVNAIMTIKPVNFEFKESNDITKENCYQLTFLCENALEQSILYITEDTKNMIFAEVGIITMEDLLGS